MAVFAVAQQKICGAQRRKFLKIPEWFLRTKKGARGVEPCPYLGLVSGKQSAVSVKGFLQNPPGRGNLTVDKGGGNASGLCDGFGVQHGASCESFLGSVPGYVPLPNGAP